MLIAECIRLDCTGAPNKVNRVYSYALVNITLTYLDVLGHCRECGKSMSTTWIFV